MSTLQLVVISSEITKKSFIELNYDMIQFSITFAIYFPQSYNNFFTIIVFLTKLKMTVSTAFSISVVILTFFQKILKTIIFVNYFSIVISPKSVQYQLFLKKKLFWINLGIRSINGISFWMKINTLIMKKALLTSLNRIYYWWYFGGTLLITILN